MEYKTLGRTGVQVSRLSLGAMMFGSWGADQENSTRIIHAALDAGINMIDTADIYSAGESEEFVGKALVNRRESVVLATKFHNRMGPDINQAGNSRRWIMKACEDSLRRLNTDHIDLYQIHRPDPDCDFDETLGALTDLVAQGKILYVGSSTFPASAIVECQWLAADHGYARVVCEQPPYSMLSRGVEADVLPTCERHRIGVIAWSPLSGGWLSGKHRVGIQALESSRLSRVPARYDLGRASNQLKLQAVEQLALLAESKGHTLVHMALAFVLANPSITSAIIGPRTLDQLTSQLGAIDLVLDNETLDRIDEIVTPGTNFSWDDVWAPPTIAQSQKRRPSMQ